MLNYNDFKLLFKEEEETKNEAENLKRQRLELDKERHQLKMRQFELKEKIEAEAYERKLAKLQQEETNAKTRARQQTASNLISIFFYVSIIVIYLFFLTKII